MIKFEQVSKTYPGGQRALSKVNFHIAPGEMAFLTGHSGAGKSTLLKLISLMERPTVGRVLINGHDLNAITRRDIAYIRRDIGMIFQSHQLLMDKSVFDNVALPLVIEGYTHKEIRKRVEAALEMVGLRDKARCLPITLSGGEQQRVGIARAVVNKPPLLLADEPTGNLDPKLSMEIIRLFEDFNQAGVSVLIATHDLGLIARMRYRTLTLKNGQMITDGLTDDLDGTSSASSEGDWS
ncbi:cell division ATP-binding protein FtsE [Alteromonas macleodii]|jgi:cell division transport system ATP-binding protein|uniref:Cell division ATP-binding protein FtsE n=1 Tax=Alteromonas macleodii TaxID=28108 RepID=A0A126Q5U0_ALTMA|nr:MULTISPECIES: cell division ATP-binding protein FtsE [Alteromonas]MEC7282753.1 cell division ATP-binding protein FtsE [Pseudomonadota bacterium]NKX21053.1 cell division ATP-binding protein FtsE [Alteromonadaceae bacterium A_SAG2]AMJ99869.1 cell division ATP-binding protein FtsE [Alteromonas macleodii]MAL72652.1 cell division ATP-binding protein FtsE [Alteromonas sp.]MAW02457.1 cell division ATP-binding protein FtsE [Alteromonas sp.]|tara:strand:+ start:470 stop:1183 length:714 start_codon:yes stop_codon:yes gene_type:complete